MSRNKWLRGLLALAFCAGLLCVLAFVFRERLWPEVGDEGGALKKNSLSELLGQLHDTDAATRQTAALELADFPDLADHADLAVPKLVAALKYQDNLGLGIYKDKGENGSLRATLVQALRNAGPKGKQALKEAAVPLLIHELETEGLAVQDHNLRVLSQLGPLAEQAIPAAAQLTKSTNQIVRTQAFETLKGIGPKAYPTLLNVARHGDSRTRCEVLKTFRWGVEAPEAILPALIDFLNDPDAEVRYRAAAALEQIGPAAATAVPALIDHLGDVALAAASDYKGGHDVIPEALARIGAPAVPGLLDALDHRERDIRIKAVSALGKIGPPARAAIPPLLKILDDADRVDVAVGTSIALLQIGADGRQPVHTLLTALAHASPQVRAYTLMQVRQLDFPRPELLPTLVRLLEDGNREVIHEALWVLQGYGPEAKPALPQLIRLLDQPSYKTSVFTILKNLGPLASAALPKLVTLLKDKRLKEEAVETLGYQGAAAEPAVPALVAALEDDPSARRVVLRVLGKIGVGAKAAIPAILRLLGEADLSNSRRYELLQALGDFGPHAHAAVPVLMKMLQGNDFPPGLVPTLGKIGPAAKEAIPVLQARLPGADVILAAEIHCALARITGDSAPHAQALVALYQKIPPGSLRQHERQVVLHALAPLGEHARPIVPVLVEVLKLKGLESRGLQYTAFQVLGQLGEVSREAVPQLLVLVKESDDVDKRAAINTLGDIGPATSAAMPLLEERSHDRDQRIREAARQALTKIRTPRKGT